MKKQKRLKSPSSPVLESNPAVIRSTRSDRKVRDLGMFARCLVHKSELKQDEADGGPEEGAVSTQRSSRVLELESSLMSGSSRPLQSFFPSESPWESLKVSVFDESETGVL